jgi:hypothetical protein
MMWMTAREKNRRNALAALMCAVLLHSAAGPAAAQVLSAGQAARVGTGVSTTLPVQAVQVSAPLVGSTLSGKNLAGTVLPSLVPTAVTGASLNSVEEPALKTVPSSVEGRSALPAIQTAPPQTPSTTVDSPVSAKLPDAPSLDDGAAVPGLSAQPVPTGPAHSDGMKEASARIEAFLGDLRFKTPPLDAKASGSFVVPNERHPEDMRAILEHSPGGAYMTVGTERGFIGAALGRGITHLVLMDLDPAVILYDRTNIALLRLARTREEYSRLRSKAGRREWVSLAKERGLTDLLPLLEAPETWEKWRYFQRRNLKDSWWSRALDRWAEVRPRLLPSKYPLAEDRTPEFAGVNYVRDEGMFKKLKAMADLGHIQTVAIDLTDEEAVRGLLEALARSAVPLGVLDLSNVWERTYMESRAVISLVRSFAKAALAESLLMLTRGGTIVLEVGTVEPWFYLGFHFGDILARQSQADAIKDIFGYFMNGYRRNAVNQAAQPSRRPNREELQHSMYLTPTYGW